MHGRSAGPGGAASSSRRVTQAWLNPIEKWFSVLARCLLRRASFQSLDELSRRIHHFIDHYNTLLARPYRFRSRKTAAQATA